MRKCQRMIEKSEQKKKINMVTYGPMINEQHGPNVHV